MKDYPDVSTKTVIPDVPCGVGWEEYRGTMVQDSRVLQSVAHLAVDFARHWSNATIMADAMEHVGHDDPPKRRNWNYEELARNACDAATALYLEFEARNWFLNVPGPTKKAP